MDYTIVDATVMKKAAFRGQGTRARLCAKKGVFFNKKRRKKPEPKEILNLKRRKGRGQPSGRTNAQGQMERADWG